MLNKILGPNNTEIWVDFDEIAYIFERAGAGVGILKCGVEVGTAIGFEQFGVMVSKWQTRGATNGGGYL